MQTSNSEEPEELSAFEANMVDHTSGAVNMDKLCAVAGAFSRSYAISPVDVEEKKIEKVNISRLIVRSKSKHYHDFMITFPEGAELEVIKED